MRTRQLELRRRGVTLIAVLAVGLGAGSCAGGGVAAKKPGIPGGSGTPATGSVPSPHPLAASVTPVTGSGPAGCTPGDPNTTPAKGYGLGERTVTFTDASRPTNADPYRTLPARPARTIAVTLVYPSTVGTGDDPVTDGAPVAAGAFPLILVSHGVTSNGPTMARIVQGWARAGYVLAAPTYPLSSGAGAHIDDLPRQPGDIAFVIRSLQALFAQSSDELHGHVEAACVALAGHSLGAATTLEAGYESGYAVPGVTAVIEMSGLLAPLPPGSFLNPPPIPLLLLHGDKDTVVPISGSQTAFASLSGRRYFVTFRGASHNSIFSPPYHAVLDTAAIAFLDAELKGQGANLLALGQKIEGSGVASLETRP